MDTVQFVAPPSPFSNSSVSLTRLFVDRTFLVTKLLKRSRTKSGPPPVLGCDPRREGRWRWFAAVLEF